MCRTEPTPTNVRPPLRHARPCLAIVAHLGLILCGAVEHKSMLATGTLTCHTWLAAWFARAYAYGFDDPLVSVELPFLLSQLASLAVGALLFTRVYSPALIQRLAVVYLARASPAVAASEFGQWFEASAKAGPTGLVWNVCEVCDVLAHQVPVLVCFLAVRADKRWPQHWPMAAAYVGLVQRVCWDLSVCGELACDGPYHGALKGVPVPLQYAYHFLPGLALVLAARRGWRGGPLALAVAAPPPPPSSRRRKKGD